jgi:hypothetical protein
MTTSKRIWSPQDFTTSDEVLVNGHWLPVVRVNPKTITVENPMGWKDRYAYADIQDRKRKDELAKEPFYAWTDGVGTTAELFRDGPDAMLVLLSKEYGGLLRSLGPIDDATAIEMADQAIEEFFEAIERELGL